MKKYKIAITGPESTGKTTLAQQLAVYFNTIWVPEFARSYIETLARPYHYDDILLIAKEQMKKEDEAFANHDVIFLDTELLVTKIWCEYKYGQCHSWILDEIKRRKYDLVLLCNIDLPWTYDPQREHPHKRQELWTLYKSQAYTFYHPVEIVSGQGNERFDQAILAIRKWLPELFKIK